MSKKSTGNGKGGRILFGVLATALAVLLFFGGWITSQLTLDSELRSLIRLKNTVQAQYYEEITDEEFYRAVFDGVNDNLLDKYSKYMTADEYAQTLSEAAGNKSGLGLVFLTESADGKAQLLITRVCGNSPAEAAGLKAGEYVLGFGESAQTIVNSVAFNEFSSFLAEYSAGETFFLRVRSGDSERVVELAKAEYVESYVFYRTNEKSFCFTGNKARDLTERGEPLASLPSDTAYIRLTQFNGEAAQEFKQVMNLFKTQGKKNLVLDLRDNGGGYLHIMQSIASYFCKNGEGDRPLVAVADYGERKENYYADGNYYHEYFVADSRICVLADSSTASASEALLGCMLDYGAVQYGDICLSERAGEARTYGKGIMQTTFPFGLIYSDAVKLTTAKILWPVSNNCIHGRGVLKTDGALSVAENYVGDNEINAAIAKLFA
ncbi:MAG: hypothetical protein IJW60_00055 [Clostridia bacterium]|nr:hypothetical protein [Clostridia bacterium]